MADDTAGEARRERNRAAQQRYREANPDKYRRYREKNADKIRESRRRYRQENKEKIAEYVRQDRAKNPEKYRERNRQWRARNPEKAREHSRRRAPLRESMGVIHGRDWRADYAAFWEAQGGRCYLCGAKLPEDSFPNPPGRGPAIDHDHRCCPRGRSCRACRRGIACQRCNTAVGLFGDDPALLRRVADSLEAALGLVGERLNGRPRQDALF